MKFLKFKQISKDKERFLTDLWINSVKFVEKMPLMISMNVKSRDEIEVFHLPQYRQKIFHPPRDL